MSYGVEYQAAAHADLADAWLRAADKQAVNNASFLIDQLLASVPDRAGAAHGVFRRLSLPPLEVPYRVFPGTSLVRVFRIELVE
jgi:hypothetical protein